MQRIISILILLTISACSTVGLTPPEVSLVDVRFDEMSLLETNLKAKVRYENESNKAIRSTGTVHELTLNDIYIGKAMSDESLTIPRLGTATQEVTFRLSNISLLTKIQQLMNSNRLDYDIESKIYVGSGFTGSSLTQHNSGKILQQQ